MMTGQSKQPLPRWRGFNLLEMFGAREATAFREDDFRWVAELGFDFIRLPLDYLCWTDPQDMFKIDESVFGNLDLAVEYGRKHGIHVCINFHNAPGFRVGTPWKDAKNLFHNPDSLKAFAHQWNLLAKRYRGISSERVSFNLVNEPPFVREGGMSRDDHARVMRTTTAAIRDGDPDRLVIIDGVNEGRGACPELADLGIAQSCRGYDPLTVSHYKAPWAGGMDFPLPVWPNTPDPYGDAPWDRKRLEEHYRPWVDLAKMGVGVHCGECGCFNLTPHDVMLRWFRETLEIFTANNIGYALWNFRGPFGILDSERSDVRYEDWHGHKLDRKYLELLSEF